MLYVRARACAHTLQKKSTEESKASKVICSDGARSVILLGRRGGGVTTSTRKCLQLTEIHILLIVVTVSRHLHMSKLIMLHCNYELCTSRLNKAVMRTAERLPMGSAYFWAIVFQPCRRCSRLGTLGLRGLFQSQFPVFTQTAELACASRG